MINLQIVDCGARHVKIDFASTVFINSEAKDMYMVEPKRLVKNIIRDYPKLMEITEGNLAFEMNMPLCIWNKDFLNNLKEKDQVTSVCHLLKKQGIIFDVNGNLVMCNGLFDFPIGKFDTDFSDTDSLLEFLNEEKIQNYYDKIACYPSDECQNCIMYKECGGGCPLKWTIYKPDSLCQRR